MKSARILAAFFLIGTVQVVSAQSVVPTKDLQFQDALNYALQHYPAVRASLERVNAAHAGVSLARAQYLPSFSAIYQDSRATQNQVSGIWLPASITPTVIGPTGNSSGQSYWGSQTAGLFSWEPIDFGLRRSMVDQAKSADDRSNAELSLTWLEVTTAVGDYFLTAIAANQAVKAAQANVDRWQVVDQSVRTLVDNALRPGVDASRADAQLALAKTRLFQAQQAEQAALATLAALMGTAGSEIHLDLGPLLKLPSNDSLPTSPLENNPAARDQLAALHELQSREKVLGKTDYPRVFLQGVGLARGSEVPNNGSYLGNWNGLAPARGNWVAGITITFPNVFDFKALGAQKQIAHANERSQKALYDKTIQNLTGQVQVAETRLKSSQLIAQQTPIELEAAQQSEKQSRARYEASLTNMVEVADAEGLLAQAEMDDAIARLNVWHSLFALAAAQGDLQPFLDVLRSTAP